ncbi:MAG: hypothetical protein ACRDJH_23785, partial [Thermomicrobiales bacterium]
PGGGRGGEGAARERPPALIQHGHEVQLSDEEHCQLPMKITLADTVRRVPSSVSTSFCDDELSYVVHVDGRGAVAFDCECASAGRLPDCWAAGQDQCVAESAHGFLSLNLDCHAHSRVVEALFSEFHAGGDNHAARASAASSSS